MKRFMFAFVASLVLASPNFSLDIILTPFRINYLVYYHVLFKMQGIPMNEFKNVNVTSDTGSELVFEYGGREYKAKLLADQGVVYVTMPEGMRNRYISQRAFPPLILPDFDKRNR